MCNLYRMTKGTAEIAQLFRVEDRMAGANLGADVYPGYPGAVVAGGELRRMTWGFPLLVQGGVMKGAKGQMRKPRPVNNARSDKLDSFMWRYSFEERRCLIPMTGWAEAEGEKGAKTRTWLRMAGSEVFAAAGIWRWSEEWGEVYSMVMTDSCGAAAECHDRMPVLLAAGNYGSWLGGTAAEAKALCVPYEGPVAVERTVERWGK